MTLERNDDGVAVVTLNNGKVNALSSGVVRRLHEIAVGLAADPPGAVVITGGERIFAAGADISEFGSADQAGPITVADPRRARRGGGDPAHGHRRRRRVRPRRRLRAGPRVRLSDRR